MRSDHGGAAGALDRSFLPQGDAPIVGEMNGEHWPVVQSASRAGDAADVDLDWSSLAILVAESSVRPLLLLDVEGRIRHVNRAMEQVLGWRGNELRGRPWFDLCKSDEAHRADSWLDEVLRGRVVKAQVYSGFGFPLGAPQVAQPAVVKPETEAVDSREAERLAAQRASSAGLTRLMFVVADTGAGMSRSQLALIFGQGRFNEGKGPGLGLAISMRLAKLMRFLGQERVEDPDDGRREAALRLAPVSLHEEHHLVRCDQLADFLSHVLVEAHGISCPRSGWGRESPAFGPGGAPGFRWDAVARSLGSRRKMASDPLGARPGPGGVVAEASRGGAGGERSGRGS